MIYNIQRFSTHEGEGIRTMIFDPFDIVTSKIGPDVGVIGAASLLLESS
ncbi:MAG TPA: hypothetical protein PLN06_09300 [Bacteroidales bacterium]|nr:hypothetical protein [Bacteroidales bacterium]HQG37403.1 hypothetical protein [Bacteroidales bacterium]HQG52019.1 hypothetical protein [Bacteroidales bacterium]HQJ21530.1 hypothetical protein [Bacteroidales bacterium]HRC90036.1 hypothetical protein [Bacteroidales bacterium]